MKKTFVHEWDPDELTGNVLDQPVPEPVRIRMSISAADGFWLSANREGYAYLARFFSEVASGGFEDGWHTHRDEHFGWSTGAPEFTFGMEIDVTDGLSNRGVAADGLLPPFGRSDRRR